MNKWEIYHFFGNELLSFLGETLYFLGDVEFARLSESIMRDRLIQLTTWLVLTSVIFFSILCPGSPLYSTEDLY